MRTAIHAARYLFLATLLVRPAFAADESPADENVVTGQVVDEAGHAVKSALVRIPTAQGDDKREATTDDNGRFKLTVPPDIIPPLLTCIAAADDGSRQGYFQSKVSDRRFPESISIVLRPPREIQASVVDKTGEPVPETHVQAFTRFYAVAHSLTDASGRAVLKIPAGLPLYAVTAVKSGAGLDYFLFRMPPPFTLEPKQLSQTFDSPLKFRLTGARKAIVAISDTHAKPIEAAHLSIGGLLLPGKGGYFHGSGLVGQDQYTATDGTATFDFVPAADESRIAIHASKQDTHESHWSWYTAPSLAEPIKVTLPELIAARGRVLDADGRPVAEADVKAYSRGGVKSNADGDFELLLPRNRYYQIVARKDRDVSPDVLFVLKQDPVDGLVARLKPATRVFGTVTIGPDNAPVKHQLLQLIQNPIRNHLDLPEEQRLPTPANGRAPEFPRYVQSTLTDAEGRFEFLVGPGEYYLHGPRLYIGQVSIEQFERARFTVDNQKELEIDLHGKSVDASRLIGRVFYKDQPGKPLARAQVFIYSDRGTTSPSRPSAITDENGIFQLERPGKDATIYVQAEDNSFVAAARIEKDQRRVELQAVPSRRVTGRLVEEPSGRPLPFARTSYSVHSFRGEAGDNAFTRIQFVGMMQTKLDGSFEISGFVPGLEYMANFTVFPTTENPGRTRLFTIGGVSVKLGQAESTNVGDVSLVRLPRNQRPNPENQIPRWFDGESDPTTRIKAKLRDVRLARQNLVLVIAAPVHPCTRSLYLARYNHGNPDRMEFCQATADFEFLAIQPKRLKKSAGLPNDVAKLAASPTNRDTFTLAVFSPSGELVAKASQPELTTDGQLDLEKTSAFLHDHAPKIPDAQQLIAAAFAQAIRENKKVLLQHSETLCSPCTLLSRYFDNHRTLIEKDYVWVTIDPRFKHGREIINRYRPQPGGIPWFAIIAPDGKPLATSDSEQGNIGYPSTDLGRKHFESILRQTAPHLTDDDITALLNDLND